VAIDALFSSAVVLKVLTIKLIEQLPAKRLKQAVQSIFLGVEPVAKDFDGLLVLHDESLPLHPLVHDGDEFTAGVLPRAFQFAVLASARAVVRSALFLPMIWLRRPSRVLSVVIL